MSDNQQDAQHAASPITLLQAQRHGDFPRSHDLASSFQLLCGVAACYFLVSGLAQQLHAYTILVWSTPTFELNNDLTPLTQNGSMYRLVAVLSPLLMAILLVAVVSHVAQNTTLTFFNRPLVDVSRLSFSNNLQKIFSLQNGLRSVANLPKTVFIFFVAIATSLYRLTMIAELPFMPLPELLGEMLDSIFVVLIATASAMFVMSILDYVIERYSFLQRNKMTDQQLREENRTQNVDPQVLSQRQRFYQALRKSDSEPANDGSLIQ